MVSSSNHSDGFIVECESKISSIDAQIAGLQSLRAIERNKLGKLKYRSTPLNVLPLEMLSEIFKFSVAAANQDDLLPRAVVLSEVCHYWRQVALSLPSLWSELTIEVNVERPAEGYVQATRAWLARSSPLPLSIDLFSDLDEETPESAIVNEIFGVKSRLKSLRIVGVYSAAIASLMVVPLPALQTLRLSFDDPETLAALDATAGARIDLSVVAPHLRTVVLPEDYLKLFDNVPWSRLIDLTFFTHIDDTLDILRQSRNLEQLEIRTVQWGLEEVTSLADKEPPLTLPVLRHFSLNLKSAFDDFGEIIPFFHCLVFPELTSLKLDFEMHVTTLWDHRKFALFQGRSPHIQRLELSNATLDSADLVSMLRFSPALTSLVLTACRKCIDDTLLQALEYRESDADAEPLAARLEVISWSRIGHYFHNPFLEAMLRSRCLTVPPHSKITRFKTVYIHSGEDPIIVDAAFAAQMEACVEKFHLS
ncbi:hypothetical protein B0H16DRAFT_373449 [Mycena metata]|uniref:F-box domain-containing protein n=1 Tax=Mycena metata TaxID=1033252 RepID=A0AAD7JPL1_9AGAR|nr:hypothetical protein B0H16DRAFT_373449 [Mycena metata]